MCGRYTLTASNKPDLAALKFDVPDRYNIAPQSDVLVETRLDGYTMKPWSLSPPWAAAPMHLFNARLETLDEKPSFKGSLRCVFLADGWYEWQRSANHKQPWYHHREGELMRFAGVYHPSSGCAIVTTAAQPDIAHIHHRQPVLLTAQTGAGWLASAPAEDCLTDYPVAFHQVSSQVNSARTDSPELALPIRESAYTDPQGTLF